MRVNFHFGLGLGKARRGEKNIWLEQWEMECLEYFFALFSNCETWSGWKLLPSGPNNCNQSFIANNHRIL